jgi:hypothetical protein
MATKSTQLSAAIALVQLLTEHPELHAAEWSLGSVQPSLRGFLYRGDMATLAAYADVVGGAVDADASTYEFQGSELRRHTLKTTWRDVPVELIVTLPVVAEQVAA